MGKKKHSANSVFFNRICEIDSKIETIEMKIKELKEKYDSNPKNSYLSDIRRLEGDKRDLKQNKSVSQALYFGTGAWNWAI